MTKCKCTLSKTQLAQSLYDLFVFLLNERRADIWLPLSFFRYNRKAGYVPSMYLQPYNNPLIRIMPIQKESSTSTLDLSKLQGAEGSSLRVSIHELSRSQGNLALPSGSTLAPRDKQMSRSLSILPDSSTAHQIPPAIRVEFAESDQRASLSEDSEENSFSDDGSSLGSESPSLSSAEEPLSRGCTPPTNTSGSLTPVSATQGKMIDNRSDLSLTKMPGTPKVPPRPKAQEILKRCTTVTRKNLQRTS